MMEMGIETGTGIRTGGDIDDDFPIHDDRARLFFSFKCFLSLDLSFLQISYIYPIKRHDTSINENENDDGE